MSTPNNSHRNLTGSKEDSLKERSKKSVLRRKRQLRARMILLNSAVALIVILLILVSKVISLNSQGTINSLKVAKDNSGKAKQEKTKESAEPAATPVPTSVTTIQTQPEGKDRWIRKNLDKNKPMIALTFDDGPYTPVTKKILATLKKHDQKATFFCVANRVNRYSQVVKDAYVQGCQIASHTYGHVVLTKLKKKKMLEQIDKANHIFEKTIGCASTVLRPPGGLVNRKVHNTVKVPMICWNIDSEDWKSRNRKKILRKCKNVKDGDIILMHDLYPSTAAAVEKLVPQLKKKGFLMVTVDELFYYKGITLKPGNVYFSAK